MWAKMPAIDKPARHSLETSTSEPQKKGARLVANLLTAPGEYGNVQPTVGEKTERAPQGHSSSEIHRSSADGTCRVCTSQARNGIFRALRSTVRALRSIVRVRRSTVRARRFTVRARNSIVRVQRSIVRALRSIVGAASPSAQACRDATCRAPTRPEPNSQPEALCKEGGRGKQSFSIGRDSFLRRAIASSPPPAPSPSS